MCICTNHRATLPTYSNTHSSLPQMYGMPVKRGSWHGRFQSTRYEKVLSPGSSGWKCIDMCKIRQCNGHVTGSPWEHAAKAGTGGAMWDVKTFEPMAFWIIREREREREVLMGFTMILPKVKVDRTTPHVVHFIRRLCILCIMKAEPSFESG